MYIKININSDLTPCVETCKAIMPQVETIVRKYIPDMEDFFFQTWGDFRAFSDNPYNQGYMAHVEGDVEAVSTETAQKLANEIIPYIKEQLGFVPSATPTVELSLPGWRKVYTVKEVF